MPNETRKLTEPAGWSTVKQHIKDWNAAQLTVLVKDLYDSSADNRTFMRLGA
jgi:hypothetical protein